MLSATIEQFQSHRSQTSKCGRRCRSGLIGLDVGISITSRWIGRCPSRLFCYTKQSAKNCCIYSPRHHVGLIALAELKQCPFHFATCAYYWLVSYHVTCTGTSFPVYNKSPTLFLQQPQWLAWEWWSLCW